MRVHKLRPGLVLWTLVAVSSVGPARAGGTFGPGGPHALQPSQRGFLSRVARRTVRDIVLQRGLYEPTYIPRSLEVGAVEVVVRLRRRGFLLTHAAAGPAPIVVATRDAAAACARELTRDATVDLDLVNALTIEIEVIGEAAAVPFQGDWMRRGALRRFVEPGVDGVLLEGPRLRRRFCPSELFTTDHTVTQALTAMARAAHLSPEERAKIKLWRFRTTHWVSPGAGQPPVALRRGLTLVPPEAVSPKGLDKAIERVGAYLRYRQLPSGLFTYQYEPARDLYTNDDSAVHQVGATAAMSFLAAHDGLAASRAAADRAIAVHLGRLADVPKMKDAAFVATADGTNPLGVTALACLALSYHPDPDRYADTRRRLIDGMLWLQRDSGMFLTAFPPALDVGAQDYFPGEALLALAAHYDSAPSARILDAFDRAVSFYRDYFRGAPSPALVSWQVQAFALMAHQTKRKDYRDFVFELADWLAERQLNEGNCPWEELRGGVAVRGGGRANFATAAYLEAFADALTLAVRFGDEARQKRYRRVVRGAARFVMQLQVRPEETYFMRSPADAVGGIRTGPALNLLRIDHCQHGVISLIKARRALFPEQD